MASKNISDKEKKSSLLHEARYHKEEITQPNKLFTAARAYKRILNQIFYVIQLNLIK